MFPRSFSIKDQFDDIDQEVQEKPQEKRSLVVPVHMKQEQGSSCLRLSDLQFTHTHTHKWSQCRLRCDLGTQLKSQAAS